MGLSLVQSRVLQGLQAVKVTVEVHMANGLPSFTLVGLAEVEVKEARERVRCAIQNAGLDFPHNQRITVNLAPADLPKDSGRLDLPIALGILAASGQIDGSKLAGYEFAGELSLTGALHPIRGALAMALALHSHPDTPTIATATTTTTNTGGRTRLVLPPQNAEEAALVPHCEVYRAEHLMDVVRQFLPVPDFLSGASGDAGGWSRVLPQPIATPTNELDSRLPDMADVKGQTGAKRAMEIAAAGGHSVLLTGPPGSGKSMLAHRFVTLLPPMSHNEALESAAIGSLSGRFRIENWGIRPTANPHHSASAVALVGGGNPPRPGEISLAHHGVLFLDELPEFPRAALEALREPLESGTITIVRAASRAEFPARFQLVGAMNPCPCGYLGALVQRCRCTPDQVRRYQSKLSGPFMDRIDLHVDVPFLPSEELLGTPQGESSASIRERCLAARQRALNRQGCSNAALQGKAIDEHIALDASALKFLNVAATRMGLSARSTHRILKVARTIADLGDSEKTQISHLAEAMQYRRTTGG